MKTKQVIGKLINLNNAEKDKSLDNCKYSKKQKIEENYSYGSNDSRQQAAYVGKTCGDVYGQQKRIEEKEIHNKKW